MKLLRSILAVMLGYMIFAVSAVLLFQWAGIDPHDSPSAGIKVLVVGYGLAFSFLGGRLAQWISKSGQLTVNYVLAVLMASFAGFSMMKTGGDHYTQLAAILLFAPASLAGGWVFLRRNKVGNL